MPRNTSTPTSELAKEILNYFLRNPQAADNLEGVTRWRLLEERVHRELEDTDLALGWLVNHGYLEKIASQWAGAVYRLNESNRGDAEQFVTDKKGKRKSRGN